MNSLALSVSEMVRALLDDAVNAALRDRERDMHAVHGGDGRTGRHRAESIGRHPRRMSKNSRFSLTLRGLGGQQHATAQEVEAGSSVALSLDELEPVDLSLGLPTAPGLGQCRPDHRAVRLQPGRERRDGRSTAGLRVRDPSVEVCRWVAGCRRGATSPGRPHERGEAPCQGRDGLGYLGLFAMGYGGGRGGIQGRGGLNEQLGELPRGGQPGAGRARS